MAYIYHLVKDNNYKKYIMQFNLLEGLDITPKNSSRYGIVVSKLVVTNKKFTEQILKKRIKRKLELYLKFILEYVDDDSGDGSSINQILNDIKRYKQILQYKYNKYLDEKNLEMIQKKLDIIEKELNIKLYIIEENKNMYEEEMISTKRR